MGDVYLARDSRLNPNVAIKVITAESRADERKRRRITSVNGLAPSSRHHVTEASPRIETSVFAALVDEVLYLQATESDALAQLEDVIHRFGRRLPSLRRGCLPARVSSACSTISSGEPPALRSSCFSSSSPCGVKVICIRPEDNILIDSAATGALP
jgi:hypothetical protein